MLRKHVIHSSSQYPLNAYLVHSTGMLMKEGEKRGKENTRVWGGQDIHLVSMSGCLQAGSCLYPPWPPSPKFAVHLEKFRNDRL